MKRFLFLTLILILIFSVSALALDVSIYNEVKPFTIDYVDGSGLSINGNYYAYQFSNGNDNRYAQIQEAFNVQNNAIAIVQYLTNHNWRIHVFYSGSLSTLGDWYMLSYKDGNLMYQFNYTLTNGDYNPGAPDRYYMYRLSVEVSNAGIVQDCYFGSYSLQYGTVDSYKETYAPYDQPDFVAYNYANYGVGWCNNVVMYGDEVIYDPSPDAVDPDPDEPDPDTPEYENFLEAIIDLPRRIVAFIVDGLRSLFFSLRRFYLQ